MGEPARGREDRRLALLAAAVVATLVYVALRASAVWLGALTGLVLVLIAGLVWARRRPVPAAEPPAAKLPRSLWWMSAAWLVLILLPLQKFTQQGLSGESVSRGSSASLENLLVLGWYVGLAAVVALRWRFTRGTRGPAALWAWPFWALLSSCWSIIPLYSAVRALQLIVGVAFAVWCAHRLKSLRSDGTALFLRFSRLYVEACTALAVFALLAPPPEAQQSGRLTWFGVHTLVASEVWGAGVLVLLVVGLGPLRMSVPGWALRLGILLWATLATQGRTTDVALVVAALVILSAVAAGRPALRTLVIGYYGLAWAAVALLFGHDLFVLAVRGQNVEQLWTLNTRIPLWQYALSKVDTLGSILIGRGYGSSTVMLYQKFPFAGHAHNSWLDVLLGNGIVGVGLLLLWLLTLRRRVAARLPAGPPPAVRALLLGLLTYVVVLGTTSPELAFPGFSFNLLCLMAVVGLSVRGMDHAPFSQTRAPRWERAA